MNVIATIQPTSPENYGLVPTTMSEAMQLANMMANAKLVPAALQKSPADCLMVIQQAIRWQMDPFAVAQECSVIQGKLMHSGKLVAAVINARGNLAERLSFTYVGEGDDRTVTVSGRMNGEAEPRTVTVRLKDAKTANRVWQTQPDQQLMYHGSRVWARRHRPELMLGVWSPEEFDEVTLERKPPKPAPNVMLPPHDPDTGEIINQPSPPNQPAADQAAPSTMNKPEGAAAVPTWEDYVDRWAVMLTEATDAKQLHKTWTEQRAIRNKINWPEADSADGDVFADLKARVEATINMLKQPA